LNPEYSKTYTQTPNFQRCSLSRDDGRFNEERWLDKKEKEVQERGKVRRVEDMISKWGM
jgi:hypothetical protein